MLHGSRPLLDISVSANRQQGNYQSLVSGQFRYHSTACTISVRTQIKAQHQTLGNQELLIPALIILFPPQPNQCCFRLEALSLGPLLGSSQLGDEVERVHYLSLQCQHKQCQELWGTPGQAMETRISLCSCHNQQTCKTTVSKVYKLKLVSCGQLFTVQ